jgi:hypothetical protein
MNNYARRRGSPLTPVESRLFSEVLSSHFFRDKAGNDIVSEHLSLFTYERGLFFSGLDKFQRAVNELKRQPKRQRYGLPSRTSRTMLHAFENVVQRRKDDLDKVQSAWEAWGWAQREVFGSWRRYEESISSVADQAAESTSEKDEASFGPSVYSQLVLYLITTLRDRFRSPTLALALFTRASNLSVASYVSACTTPVYNEVLRTRWYSLRDPLGFTETLKEMQAAGVGMSDATYRLVDEVVGMVSEHQNAARTKTMELHGDESSFGVDGDSVSVAPRTMDRAAAAIAEEAAELSIEVSPEALSSTSPMFEALVDSRTYFSSDELVAVREADEMLKSNKEALSRIPSRRPNLAARPYEE